MAIDLTNVAAGIGGFVIHGPAGASPGATCHVNRVNREERQGLN
jgi:hypothetical protein